MIPPLISPSNRQLSRGSVAVGLRSGSMSSRVSGTWSLPKSGFRWDVRPLSLPVKPNWLKELIAVAFNIVRPHTSATAGNSARWLRLERRWGSRRIEQGFRESRVEVRELRQIRPAVLPLTEGLAYEGVLLGDDIADRR